MSVLYLQVFCLVHFDFSLTFDAIGMLINWLILLSSYLIWSWTFLHIFQLVSRVVFMRLQYVSVFWVPSQYSLSSTHLYFYKSEDDLIISAAVYKFIIPLMTSPHRLLKLFTHWTLSQCLRYFLQALYFARWVYNTIGSAIIPTFQ